MGSSKFVVAHSFLMYRIAGWPNLYYYHAMEQPKRNLLSKNFYHIAAAVTLLAFLSLMMVIFQQAALTPSFGVIFDPTTGMVLQTLAAHPSAKGISPEDTLLSIDGIPLAQIPPDEFMAASDDILVEVQSADGEIRPVVLEHRLPTGSLYLETLALPILGFFFFFPGIVLIFNKDPQPADYHFLKFSFWAGLLLVMSQIGQLTIPWMSALYALTSLFSTWSFVEFHLSFLVVVPLRVAITIYRGIKITAMVAIVWLSLGYFLEFHREINVIVLISMILDMLIVGGLFIAQILKKEFRYGVIRVFFLTDIIAPLPVVLFTFLPYLFTTPRRIPILIAVLPLLTIPTNYFILLMNWKKWMRWAVTSLSLVVASFGGLMLAFGMNRFLPGDVQLFQFSGNWIEYIFLSLVLLLIYAILFGTNSLFRRLVYGDARAIARRLYAKSYNVVQESSVERPITVMGRSFMEEFFRFSYLNICFINGTVLRFDEENRLEVMQFDETSMLALVEQLSREHTLQAAGTLAERSVAPHELDAVRYRFPKIFGEDPRYCYLLFGAKSAIGFIAAGDRKGNEPFDAIETRQLIYLLNQFQMIVNNYILMETVEKSAEQIRLSGQRMIRLRENERKRIARDMHDNIIQAITAFRYQLNELYDSEKLDVDDEEADELQHSLLSITQDIRDICFNLRPPALDAIGLESAVISLIESYHASGTLSIVSKIEGQQFLDTLSDDIAICLYRVLQEALLNIAKHAQTDSARVHLLAVEDWVFLTVSDNGKGFTPPDQMNTLVNQGHYGLLGAREFLESVDGELEVISQIGGGTTIHATIPLNSEEVEDAVFYDDRR